MDTLPTNIVKASCCLQLITTDNDGGSAGGYHFVSRFIRDGSFITFTYLGHVDKKLIDLKDFFKKDEETVLDLINRLETSGDYIVLSERMHINTVFTMQMMGRFDYLYDLNVLENFGFNPKILGDEEDEKSKIVDNTPREKVINFMSKRKKEHKIETQESNDGE